MAAAFIEYSLFYFNIPVSSFLFCTALIVKKTFPTNTTIFLSYSKISYISFIRAYHFHGMYKPWNHA